MTRPRLLLIDGHSMAYRAFYALPVGSFSTATGQPTNAVYGFTSMLINTLKAEAPTHVAVAFDVSRKTFRSERYPEYKATRSQSPDEFRGQVDLIREVLAALSIPCVSVDGYEADDLIATLATAAVAQGFEVDIITGDRDAFQLVNERVTVLYPRKGVSELDRMTPEAIEAKYGLSPSQYPDYAALRGDPSDNLPSIPGVGEKTAVKWVVQYGTLDAIVANVGEIKGKVGDALREHLGQVMLNRQLTELVRTVPLPVGPADLGRVDFDVAAVQTIFDALQFRSLWDRLYALRGDKAVQASSPAVAVEVQVATPGDVAAWLDVHGSGPVAVAVSGTWGRGTGDLTAIALAGPKPPVLWVDPVEIGADDEAALSTWLADPAAPKVMHDAKGPMLAFRARGLPLRGLAFDTALAAYLVLPGQRGFDLPDLTLRVLDRELTAAAGQGQLVFGEDDVAVETLASHATGIRDLAAALATEVEAKGAATLLSDVELPLVEVLADAEIAGIAVDLDRLAGLDARFGAAMSAAEATAHTIVGKPFNLGSPKQLQEILFVDRKLPTTKKIKTGYTTDAEALQGLFAQTHDPLLEQLLRWRDVAKLRQTVTGLIPLATDGRIHTTYNQTVAATGRLSSTDPNLQNIPIRTDEGRMIRECFVVGTGFETLMTADYSQIEMRIMAHLSGEAGLIEAFASGEDLHTTVAARVFNVPADQVDAERRRRIKAMSYGLAYGLSAYGLSQQLSISAEEAKRLMNEYFERFGGIRDYLARVVETARSTGYTETMLGRRRYLPDLTSDNRQRREMAERMALNSPIQGSAADIIKVAMLRVDRALRQSGMASRMLLQVHDELVFEVAAGETAALEDLVRTEMRGAADLSVPLEVSVGIGTTWESAGH